MLFFLIIFLFNKIDFNVLPNKKQFGILLFSFFLREDRRGGGEKKTHICVKKKKTINIYHGVNVILKHMQNIKVGKAT